MAKESSFDIVSSFDMQEVDNAYQQAKKELSQRYDLKNSGASIDLSKQEKKIVITAPSDFVASQVQDIIESKLIKRGIELNALHWGAIQSAASGNVTKTGQLVEGIDRDVSATINKDIKAQKFKVKVQIEGDHLRVSSSSIDTLQDVISFLKGQDYGQPLQYTNYR